MPFSRKHFTISEENKEKIKTTSEKDLIMLHFGLGMGIRNDFGLWANKLIPGGEKHMVSLLTDVDRIGLFDRTPPHLSFTFEEECLGQKGLQDLGIPPGAPFVCFYSRDSGYLDNIFPNRDWSYHDYRDSSIQNYVPAAEELVCRGYFTVRMGAYVKEPLPIADPMIIDYAMDGRTDFLDIYLGAKCAFFFSSAGGFSAVPVIFRRPVVHVNLIPLEHFPTTNQGDLFIPKKLWLRSESRFLTFREILDSGAGRFLRSKQYDQIGVEVVENTLEEITAVVVEMDERLKGKWQTTEEDEELQRCFWALFKPSGLSQTIVLRIGTEFLRENRELLE